MKYLLVIAFATCGFAHTIGRSLVEDKIVGGTLASPGQFPYQISERLYGSHFCGGSIINKYTILTAAHCVDGTDPKGLNIVVGSNKLNQGGMWYYVSRYTMHANWNPATVINDIAVIKLIAPIQYTTYVKAIAIDTNFTPGGSPCVLSGWGYTSYPGTTPNDLLYLKAKVVDLNQCRKDLPPSDFPILDSNICAFSSEGIGACSGDSGGPLVSNNKQIGVTSWVFLCAVGVPDVYTRVSYYSSWIEAQAQ
ncbi:hypothetical protein RN001_015198 [Aquatica leii]|uniref:Peptidase S1 domain-containing protein n=1 Tax=Aquatica leii TaxID=1421715 RepID=A0AAN7PPC4_9COLE|nr:hypothetical protein RN001_015198 [Aquatica leii]